jgi:hypothetical protein
MRPLASDACVNVDAGALHRARTFNSIRAIRINGASAAINAQNTDGAVGINALLGAVRVPAGRGGGDT